MGKIISFDYFFTGLFERIIPHNIFFDYFFSFFSLKGSSILIWILVIVAVAILEEKKYPGISKKDKRFVLLFTVSLMLTFLFVDIGLKNFFRRPRPFSLITNHYSLAANCPVDFSFPSGHAATAFAAATVLTYFDKKRRWFYYIVAILISFSRIYLGCHYLFDVTTGGLIGYFISKMLLKFFDKLR